MLVAERVMVVISSSTSFADVGYIKHVVILMVNVKRIASLKCQSCANEQRGIAQNCPGIELNAQSFEIVENFWVQMKCYDKDQEWMEKLQSFNTFAN